MSPNEFNVLVSYVHCNDFIEHCVMYILNWITGLNSTGNSGSASFKGYKNVFRLFCMEKEIHASQRYINFSLELNICALIEYFHCDYGTIIGHVEKKTRT